MAQRSKPSKIMISDLLYPIQSIKDSMLVLLPLLYSRNLEKARDVPYINKKHRTLGKY